ncbi:uncharacterized protein F4822DRAFT_426819 [Hypoxylon trugodes]|uniref:uncharacterized protein n=1 Tax=Hypoxylon trugodes TaxID=326681 RepID=UPI002194C6A5|nr:uncharacterized protein F4822DRAFT_426819 [Hypoxylon trugodes]KAI1390966.1 hypothetical protein F4822DRAFT_426819 [Hypoxylon trugodes]
MAKERAEKKKAEKAAEKKVSEDKVKKHKKDKPEKKSKRVESSDVSDSEPSQLQDLGFPELENAIKRQKKEKKSPKVVTQSISAPKKQQEESDSDSDSDSSNESAAPLFAIDTNPTPVDLNAIPAQADAPADYYPPGTQPPPSGLKRKVRRRIQLIEKQRPKIQQEIAKKYPELSDADKEEKVQQALEKWTQNFDDKAAVREAKKRERKEKEARRIKNKKGKVLTGRRLKERTKQLNKMEKKVSRKESGISA